MLDDLAAGLGFGSAIQGLLGNEFESDEATFARDHSAHQALLNRDFQERMSSTAYQRGTADMKAAGLNPMLAYQQGGASTPGGAQGMTLKGSASNTSPTALQTAAQIQNLNAQTENTKADTQNKLDDNPNVRGVLGLQNRQMDKLRVEVENILQQVDLNVQQTRKIFEEVKNAILEGKRIEAHTGNIKIDTLLKGLEIPEATNKAEAQKKWEWYMRNIRPFSDDVSGAVNSAKTIRDMGRPTHRPNAPQRPQRTGETSVEEISGMGGKHSSGKIQVKRTRKDYQYGN